MPIRSLLSILVVLFALAVAVPAVAEDQPAAEPTPAAVALEPPLFFELPVAMSIPPYDCTPNPCADCYAEYECCLQYFCPGGGLSCRMECSRRYRDCSFTCP